MARRLAVFFFSFAAVRGQDVDGFVKMHQAWGPKASTPNVTLQVQEASRSGLTIKFRLIADGAPKDVNYSVVAWPVTQKGPGDVLKGVTLDASGMAICAGKPGTCGVADKPDDPIDLVLRPAPGEPVRLGLVSADGTTKVFAKLVPVPLRGEDRGCMVDATLLTPGAELVLIEGTGFPANGDIVMDSESAGERQGGKGEADSEGWYASAVLPYRKGVAGGVPKVTLRSAKCSPTVSVAWGRR